MNTESKHNKYNRCDKHREIKKAETGQAIKRSYPVQMQMENAGNASARSTNQRTANGPRT